MSEGGKVPWTLPGGFILKLDGQRYILLGMPSGHCMQLVSFLDFVILTMSSSALGAPCIGKETGLSIGPLDRASTEIGVNGFFWWFVHGFLAGIVCIHTVPFVVRFGRRERVFWHVEECRPRKQDEFHIGQLEMGYTHLQHCVLCSTPVLQSPLRTLLTDRSM